MYGADLLVQSLGEARGCQTRLASGLPLDRVGELGAICGTLVRILCLGIYNALYTHHQMHIPNSKKTTNGRRAH